MGAWMPDKWSCHLGFDFRPLDHSYFPDDYPLVRLVLQIDPKSSRRQEIIQSFGNICEEFNWRGHSLHEPERWSHIALEKSLRDFLIEDDHVVAIENFFLEALKELQTIKDQYSQLPWGPVPDGDEDSEEA